MNRSDRRKVEREQKKSKSKDKELQKWISTLTKDKVELINRYSEIICKNKFDEMVQALDRCFSAAMLENTNFSLDEINNIFKRSFELIQEDTEKVKKLQIETGGNWIMAVNKLEPEVREAAKKYIEEGLVKKEAIKCLEMDFPKLSKSMITNAYQKVAEEMKKEQSKEDPEINKAVEYIFEEDKEMNNKATEENKKSVVANNTTTKKDEAKKEVKTDVVVKGATVANLNPQEKSKLKIKSMVVEGENGTYKVCENGVELMNEGLLMFFENPKQLDNFHREYKQVFEMLKA